MMLRHHVIAHQNSLTDALLLAGKSPALKHVMADLIRRGADINAVDKQGTCLLHLATTGDTPCLEMAKFLIDNGANPNVQTRRFRNDGNTPLHLATTLKAVQFLLASNANPNAPNEKGETPLHVVSEGKSKEATQIAGCLLQSGADPDLAVPDCGETPLMRAVAHRSKGLVELLSAKARVNQRDLQGGTAVMCLEKGATTPHDLGIVQTLVAANADLTLTDNEGFGINVIIEPEEPTYDSTSGYGTETAHWASVLNYIVEQKVDVVNGWPNVADAVAESLIQWVKAQWSSRSLSHWQSHFDSQMKYLATLGCLPSRTLISVVRQPYKQQPILHVLRHLSERLVLSDEELYSELAEMRHEEGRMKSCGQLLWEAANKPSLVTLLQLDAGEHKLRFWLEELLQFCDARPLHLQTGLSCVDVLHRTGDQTSATCTRCYQLLLGGGSPITTFEAAGHVARLFLRNDCGDWTRDFFRLFLRNVADWAGDVHSHNGEQNLNEILLHYLRPLPGVLTSAAANDSDGTPLIISLAHDILKRSWPRRHLLNLLDLHLGSDLEIPDPNGDTVALIVCKKEGECQLLTGLVERGADVFRPDRLGQSVFALTRERNRRALLESAEKGATALLQVREGIVNALELHSKFPKDVALLVSSYMYMGR